MGDWNMMYPSGNKWVVKHCPSLALIPTTGNANPVPPAFVKYSKPLPKVGYQEQIQCTDKNCQDNCQVVSIPMLDCFPANPLTGYKSSNTRYCGPRGVHMFWYTDDNCQVQANVTIQEVGTPSNCAVRQQRRVLHKLWGCRYYGTLLYEARTEMLLCSWSS